MFPLKKTSFTVNNVVRLYNYVINVINYAKVELINTTQLELDYLDRNPAHMENVLYHHNTS